MYMTPYTGNIVLARHVHDRYVPESDHVQLSFPYQFLSQELMTWIALH